jgi:hypothetical protein
MVRPLPKSIAQHLVEDAGLNNPVDLFAFCESIEINTVFCDIDAEALLVCKDGKRKIVLKRNIIPPRTRFSIAHELGHFFIPWHVRLLYLCNEKDIMRNGGKIEENEANAFAAELLMPERILKDNRLTQCNLETIGYLSSICKVSMTAAAIRLNDCVDQEVAIVFCKGKDVLWTNVGKLFPGRIRRERPYSETIKDLKTDCLHSHSRSRKIRGQSWLLNYPDATLTEQMILMPGFDGILTILRFEDADDFEEKDLDW